MKILQCQQNLCSVELSHLLTETVFALQQREQLSSWTVLQREVQSFGRAEAAEHTDDEGMSATDQNLSFGEDMLPLIAEASLLDDL